MVEAPTHEYIIQGLTFWPQPDFLTLAFVVMRHHFT